MKTVINSYNHTQNNFFIRKELNEKDIQNDKTPEVTISYQTKEKIENVDLKVVDSTPKTIINIDSKMIIQLQEFQDSTTLSILPQKTNEIKDDINFNGTPLWSWLRGRDDKLYNRYMGLADNGSNYIKKNNEIIERTKNDTVLSKEDYTTIQGSINGFDLGVFCIELDRETTTDSIVHKVLDYKKMKGLEYINQLKQFLSTKTKELEIETFKLKTLDIKTDTNPQQLVSSNRETTELLDFLAKDLRWYKWYLEDEKESFISFYPLKSKQLSKSGNKPTIVETGTMNKLEAEEVQTRLADFFVEKNINSLKIASYSHYEFARYVSLLSDETKSAKVSSPYETMLWQTLKDNAMKGYEAEFINRIEEMYSGEQKAKVVAINGEVMKEIEMLQK